jgi:hypothetical protein
MLCLRLRNFAAKPESPLVKTLLGGIATIALDAFGGHYLEMIKIKKQTSPNLTYAQLTKEMLGKKGIVGLWDGFLPW